MFYWDNWNRQHVTEHGVSPDEAASVVRRPQPPYLESCGGGKYRVWGRTAAGRLIQVVFAFKSSEEIDYEQMSLEDILALEDDPGPYVYILHARDLTGSEKRVYHRRRR